MKILYSFCIFDGDNICTEPRPRLLRRHSLLSFIEKSSQYISFSFNTVSSQCDSLIHSVKNRLESLYLEFCLITGMWNDRTSLSRTDSRISRIVYNVSEGLRRNKTVLINTFLSLSRPCKAW